MCYIRILSTETFHFVSLQGNTWLECTAFAGIPWLVHAFGTRQSGAFRPKPTRKNSDANSNNGLPLTGPRQLRFFEALGAGDFELAALRQTHSSTIFSTLKSSGRGGLLYQLAGNPLPDADSSSGTRSGDALLADQASILLAVRVADCLPVLIVDPARRAIAAVHAGWRGALNRIIEKAVGEMCRVFDSRPDDLIAALGPSIRSCCYEVGQEVVDAFCGVFPSGEDFFRRVLATPEESRMALRYQTLFSLQAPPGHRVEEALSKVHLDLAAAARCQLEHAGVPHGQIHVADYCTACRTDLFYSYRKEGSHAGRMLAVIGMRP